MNNYYKNQLDNLDKERAKHIRLGDDFPNSTHFLDLNLESLPILIEFLKEELKRLEGGLK